MFHRLLAVFLLGLMSVATATSQGRICYCLCLQTITVGQPGCAMFVDEDTSHAEGEGECHCCEKKTEAETTQAVVAAHDCMISLEIDLGDYCGSSESAVDFKEKKAGNESFPRPRGELIGDRKDSISSSGVRGPPGQGRLFGVPLYLRHQVLLV